MAGGTLESEMISDIDFISEGVLNISVGILYTVNAHLACVL